MSGREKKAFSCTLSVLANNFLGPKKSNSGKTIKIVLGEESGFYCVFEKLCSSENAILECFQQTQQLQ